MRIMIVLFMLVSSVGNAQEIEVPSDSTPQEPGAVSEVAMKKTTLKAKWLRKREHNLSWDYSTIKTKVKIEGLPASDTTAGLLNVGYGYNWGYFEAGANYGLSIEESGTDEVNVGLLVLYGRYNFIKNSRGHDLIPYAALGIVSYREEDETSGVKTEAEGTGTGGAIGLNWFPFGQIFAMDVSYYYYSISGDVSQSNIKLDAELKRSGLAVGWSVYF